MAGERMSVTELERALAVARQVAVEAGELLVQGRRGEVTVEQKGVIDLVTEHDRRSEELVVEALSRAFPEHRVVAEEGREVGGAPGSPVWYVDPLDGTTNYAHGVPFYAVALGLELEGVPQVGVVHLPELDWQFYARRGGGAFRNNHRLRVSETETLERALIGTGFPYDRRTSAHTNVPQAEAVLLRCQGIRRIGSAALDCALVASGKLDGYWEFKINPWDVSAGALLVEEAGGTVTDVSGEPFCSDGRRILATNGRIHDELGQILRRFPLP